MESASTDPTLDPISAEIQKINQEAIAYRRADLERKLSNELRLSQSDLVSYHIEKEVESSNFAAISISKAVSTFQEVFTAIFDAVRSAPKNRYRPSAENTELSTFEFSMAVPTASVLVLLHIPDERLLALQTDIDKTFELLAEIVSTSSSDAVRGMAKKVGVASISKAHAWASNSACYGLNVDISVRKDSLPENVIRMSATEAQALKESIETKSDKYITIESIEGELLGIDIDKSGSYFHLRCFDGIKVEGKLAEEFPSQQQWAVKRNYLALLRKSVTIFYATGDERIDWALVALKDTTERERTS